MLKLSSMPCQAKFALFASFARFAWTKGPTHLPAISRLLDATVYMNMLENSTSAIMPIVSPYYILVLSNLMQ